MEYYVILLVLAAVLGLIPAYIAKSKGRSFALWWIYGWMLFIVAIIHVQFISDFNGNDAEKRSSSIPYSPSSLGTVADEIQKYKNLLDQGTITEEEYREKKEQLLRLKG